MNLKVRFPKKLQIMKLKVKLRVILPLSAILTIASLFVFQSCERDDENFDYQLEIPEEYNQIGKLHNQGLNFVFRAIREAHLENMKNVEYDRKSTKTLDYYAISENAIKMFCMNHEILSENFDVLYPIVGNSYTSLKSGMEEFIASDKLSPIQKELVNKIFAKMEIEISNNNLKKLKRDLDEINSYAFTELSETEAGPIYCATSTAYATYQYWNKNYKKWYFALNFPDLLKKYNDSQLNKLTLKSGDLKSTSEDWWSDIWSDVEEWYEDTVDALEIWWEEDGEETVNDDVAGAVAGGMMGVAIATTITAYTAGAGAPSYASCIINGASAGAIYASVTSIIDSWNE